MRSLRSCSPRHSLDDPATIRLRRDDADHVGNIVVELLADCQQKSAVVRAGNDPVATELSAEDLDLGLEEADVGIPARGAGFKKEVQSNVEPAEHSF